MSFQRMIEMARRHGMPIVVTDPNGKEPVVVLSLEVYEALIGEGSGPKVVGVRKSQVPMPENLAELSVEERFYVEPLDEPRNA